MSKLVDPHICPDCRAPLDASATCTGCGLALVGPTAAELWQTMQRADQLVEHLRTTAVPATAATLPTAPPVMDPTRPRRSLPGASVPVVLLTLGGLCLFVAAVVFVAVAWSSLGLAARTVILLTVTALLGAAAAVVTRRELRFAAETLWLVVSALVALDLGAAHGADLLGLGGLADRDAVGLVGGTLLGLAVGVGAWATTTPLRRVHGLTGVAALGTILLAGAEAWTSDDNPVAVAVSVPLLAGLGWAIDRVTDGHVRRIAVVVGGAALVSWLVLLGHGVDRMATTATDRVWWSELVGWPLLVAAALAAVPVVVPRVPAWAREVSAGAGLVSLVLLAVGPSTGPTADVLTLAGVSVLVAAVAAVAPVVWSRPAAVIGAVGLVLWVVEVLERPLEVISRLPESARPDRADLDLHLSAAAGGPASWTAIVSVLAIGALAAGSLRHLPGAQRRDAGGRVLVALGPTALALGAATALLETGPTLLVAVLAWGGVLAVAGTMAAATGRQEAPLLAALLAIGYLTVTGIRLTMPSHLLAAALATAVALGVAAGHSRAPREALRGALLPLLASATVLAAGFAATHWPYPAGGRADAAGLCAAGIAAAAILLARPLARGRASRAAIEVTGLLVGLGATAYPTDPAIVAIVLTIVGSAVAVTSVLEQDRDEAAWVGVALLGVATVLRLVEDVRAPELFTLPAALVLLVAGWRRLRQDPATGSHRALSSGLTLGLVPSLLIALDEPVSPRGALVAAAGVLVLAVGVARLWAAPFAAGAITTAALALRHLGPVVDGLPRWISLGTLGVLLLVVGITWEQRRRDVTAAGRYLASLR